MHLEEKAKSIAGLPMLVVSILVLLASFPCIIFFSETDNARWLVGSLGLVLLGVLGVTGLYTVQPNQARVLQLFGAYRGSDRDAGLRWAIPFYSKARISLRTRNFETGKLKVNDSSGNPVEIASVIVWRVVDSAEAIFNVEDFVNYVEVQSEAALRSLATGYPYDAHEEGEQSLSGDTGEISEKLCIEVQQRMEKAGIEVIETRISHLAYAPEIAAAMLQRQQASAVVAARQKIVEGAVGMVEQALEEIAAKGVVPLDDDRKAAMVSNLLVVLCSDRHTQPVVNTGSIYH